MFDTECAGRQGEAFSDRPELHRIRIFRPNMPNNPNYERLQYGRKGKDLKEYKSQYPTYDNLADSFEGCVNIGPLIPYLHQALEIVQKRRPSALADEL